MWTFHKNLLAQKFWLESYILLFGIAKKNFIIILVLLYLFALWSVSICKWYRQKLCFPQSLLDWEIIMLTPSKIGL